MASKRLSLPAGGTSNVQGNVTLTFPVVPSGLIWSGSISIPGSPNYAKWSLYVNNSLIATWSGSTPIGPIQVVGSDQIKVTGSNLLANTPIAALLVGSSDEEGDTPYLSQQPNTPSIGSSAATLYANATANNGSPGGVFRSQFIYTGGVDTVLVTAQAFSGFWNFYLAWYDGPAAGNTFIAQDQYFLDGISTGETSIEAVSVKGAFLQIQASPTTAIQDNLNITIEGLIYPRLEQMPTFAGGLIASQNSAWAGPNFVAADTPVAIAANTSTTFPWQTYFVINNLNWSSGRATLFVMSTVKTWTCQLQAKINSGLFANIDGIDSHGTDLMASKQIWLPKVPTQLVITNNGVVAGNFTFTVTGA